MICVTLVRIVKKLMMMEAEGQKMKLAEKGKTHYGSRHTSS
jgi:hypothetical protein